MNKQEGSCYIDGKTLIPIVFDFNKEPAKQAVLKIRREYDKKELSINFDNSCGAFGNRCTRIEAVIFNSPESNDFESRTYISSALELAQEINKFLGI